MDKQRRNWLLGMTFVLIVATIWVVSSYLVQSMEESGLPPFILTYICNSLFVVYIPLVETLRKFNNTEPKGSSEISHSYCEETEGVLDHLYKIFQQSWFLKSRPSGNEVPGRSSLTEQSQRSPPVEQWSRARIAAVSFLICPFWFLAQFTFNVSLNYTSVTSNTILSSTSSITTFLFSMYFLGERFTLTKALSISFVVLGTIFVAFGDHDASDPSNPSNNSTIVGDALVLLSSVCYAAYTSLIRGLTPAEGGESEMGVSTEEKDKNETNFSAALMFGYIGLWNLILFFPVGLVVYLVKAEPFLFPSGKQLGLVVCKGLFDNVLSDYLWARAVLLTTPTAATAGLQIQIPVAMVSDASLGLSIPGILQVLGAIFVLIGFLGVNATVTLFNARNAQPGKPDNDRKILECTEDESFIVNEN